MALRDGVVEVAHGGSQYVKVLTAMSRDSFARVCALLTKLVMEKYHLLKSRCRRKVRQFKREEWRRKATRNRARDEEELERGTGIHTRLPTHVSHSFSASHPISCSTALMTYERLGVLVAVELLLDVVW